MATQTVTGNIQLRRDTASNWATENPTLLAGEMGVETDTLKCKIGDGSTAWNSLSYAFGGGGSGIYSITEGSTNGTISVDGTDVAVHGLGSNAYDSTSYLPLAGGTMTNQITFGSSTSLAIRREDTSGILIISGGNAYNNSAVLRLYGKDSTSRAGEFLLYAADNNNSKLLNGKPDGALTWGGTAISLDGHTHSEYLTSSSLVYEANLQWGGKNFTGAYGCIDAAMVDELGANRMMFAKAAGITVEYSRDAGSTWIDYGLTDAQKVGLFSVGGSANIGKADSTNKATANTNKYQLRITINTSAAEIYTTLNKFVIYVFTNGSNSSTVTIQKALESTPNTYVTIAENVSLSGWAGYNVVNVGAFTTYGNTAASQYGRIRFIFKADGGNTNYVGLQVGKIMGFGGIGWTTPSTMAKTGHIYSFDSSQNATFPAGVDVTGTLKQNGTAVSLSGHTHNYAGSSSAGGSASAAVKVNATYSGSSGKQNPSYFGKNYAGFLMSNETVNGDSHYKNWIYVDAYHGNDVGGCTAIGLDRTEARAFIMQSDANRTSWNNSAELLTNNSSLNAANLTGTVPSGCYSNDAVTSTAVAPTSETIYYLTLSTSSSTATDGLSKSAYARLQKRAGTASTEGLDRIYLGNTTAKGTAGNSTGSLLMYGTKGYYAFVQPHIDDTGNRTLYFPKSSGTLVCHTTDTKIGDTNKPVYISADGVATAISYTIDKSVPSNAVFTDTNNISASSNAENGYIQFNNGLIIQWGTETTNSNPITVTFPKAFPNYCRSFVGTYTYDTSDGGIAYSPSIKSLSKTAATVAVRTTYTSLRWIAIGY